MNIKRSSGDGTLKSIITIKTEDKKSGYRSSDSTIKPLKSLKTVKTLTDNIKRRGSNVSKLTDIMIAESEQQKAE